MFSNSKWPLFIREHVPLDFRCAVEERAERLEQEKAASVVSTSANKSAIAEAQSSFYGRGSEGETEAKLEKEQRKDFENTLRYAEAVIIGADLTTWTVGDVIRILKELQKRAAKTNIRYAGHVPKECRISGKFRDRKLLKSDICTDLDNPAEIFEMYLKPQVARNPYPLRRHKSIAQGDGFLFIRWYLKKFKKSFCTEEQLETLDKMITEKVQAYCSEEEKITWRKQYFSGKTLQQWQAELTLEEAEISFEEWKAVRSQMNIFPDPEKIVPRAILFARKFLEGIRSLQDPRDVACFIYWGVYQNHFFWETNTRVARTLAFSYLMNCGYSPFLMMNSDLDLNGDEGFLEFKKKFLDALTFRPRFDPNPYSMVSQLCEAAKRGDTQQLSDLLSQNPSAMNWATSVAGWTPLHFSYACGQIKAAELLKRQGASRLRNEQNKFPDQCTLTGFIPLNAKQSSELARLRFSGKKEDQLIAMSARTRIIQSSLIGARIAEIIDGYAGHNIPGQSQRALRDIKLKMECAKNFVRKATDAIYSSEALDYSEVNEYPLVREEKVNEDKPLCYLYSRYTKYRETKLYYLYRRNSLREDESTPSSRVRHHKLESYLIELSQLPGQVDVQQTLYRLEKEEWIRDNHAVLQLDNGYISIRDKNENKKVQVPQAASKQYDYSAVRSSILAQMKW